MTLRALPGRLRPVLPVLPVLLSALFVTVLRPTLRLFRRVRASVDAGMSTAEYAVGTVAAVGFAVVLYKVVRSPAVSSALAGIVKSALNVL